MEAEEGCLTQAHTVTQGLGPGGLWGLARGTTMGGHGGEQGLFAVGCVCLCLSACVLGLVSRQTPSLHHRLHWLLSLTATRPVDSS